MHRLRELREQAGLSQGDLATELTVSRQTINALEAGRWEPSLKLAFAIADRFEMTVEEIFRPERPPLDTAGREHRTQRSA